MKVTKLFLIDHKMLWFYGLGFGVWGLGFSV